MSVGISRQYERKKQKDEYKERGSQMFCSEPIVLLQ
jgi:hypothetical protein